MAEAEEVEKVGDKEVLEEVKKPKDVAAKAAEVKAAKAGAIRSGAQEARSSLPRLCVAWRPYSHLRLSRFPAILAHLELVSPLPLYTYPHLGLILIWTPASHHTTVLSAQLGPVFTFRPSPPTLTPYPHPEHCLDPWTKI